MASLPLIGNESSNASTIVLFIHAQKRMVSVLTIVQYIKQVKRLTIKTDKIYIFLETNFAQLTKLILLFSG